MSRALYESNLPLIDRVIRAVCSRLCFRGEDAEDFASRAHIKLIQDDFEVLRKFQNESALGTYLHAVLMRLGLDYRIEKWGKWRPSAAARRLGPTAITLEALISRDGHTLDEAIEITRSQSGYASVEALMELAEQLPPRLRRRMEGEDSLATLSHAGRSPEALLLQQERSRGLQRALEALREARKALPDDHRLLIRLYWEEGLSWKRIAHALGYEQKPFYRIKDQAMAGLRAALDDAGFPETEVLNLLRADQ